MDLSSGFKSFLVQIVSWTGVAALALAVFLNYDSFRALTQTISGERAGPIAVNSRAPNSRIAADVRSDETVQLRAASNGHYQARADVNGRALPVMLDTGASIVVLTYEDAQAAGVFVKPSDFTLPVSTANGVSRVAPVTLDRISIGDITVRGVQAAVAERGVLRVTLLGMSFLSRLERVDMRDGMMVLKN